MELQDYIGIAVVVIPIAIALFRLFWGMGSVQERIKQTGYDETIKQVVDVAINAVEQWAKNNTDLTSEQKKAKAMDLAKLAAMKLGVPAALLNDELVSGYIESAIARLNEDSSK